LFGKLFGDSVAKSAKNLWARLRAWFKLPSAPDLFPFEVLHGTERLRQWLVKTQRLTLISDFVSRVDKNIFGYKDCPMRSKVLLRASADIGKTREALSLIEAWIHKHGIEDQVVILVPKNLYSI